MRCFVRGSLLLLALACPATVGAQSFTAATDIPVPGGTAGVAEAIGIAAPPAVFIPELVRHIYGTPEGKNAETDRLLGVLTAYLGRVEHFEQALSAVQPRGGTFSLALATDKAGRSRLRDFLRLLGLELREKSKKFSVETSKNSKDIEAAPLLHHLGVDPPQIARRLNAGESVRIEVVSEPAPLPLHPATWTNVILQDHVSPSRLFPRVLGDRNAALLAYGLAWLDDPTLLYLSQQPGLLRKIYEEQAPVFAAFGRSLRVEGQKIAVPGGAAAEPLWEAVTGETVNQPDRFIRTLLDRHDGRFAYFYDAIASLDGPHARFALGLWIADERLRADRFVAFEATTGRFERLQPKLWPFTRPAADLGLLLARVRVQPDGAPLAPNARRLWDKVYDGVESPGDSAREVRNLRDDGAIDAAWLAEKTVSSPRVGERAERIDTFVFGQRVFGAAADATLPDVLVALRSFSRLPTLMLTLDRIGATDASLYAAAARRASAFAELGRDRAYLVLAQFQASLALLARMHAVGALESAGTQRLVRDLIAIEPTDGEYRGAVARWVDASVLPALPAAPDGAGEERILQALAGVRANAGPARTIQFEGATYRLDFAGAELKRLTAVRRKQGGYDLAQVLAFARAVHHLGTLDPQKATVADVRAAAEALKQAGEPFSADKVPPPPGLEPGRDPRQVLSNAMRDLSRIHQQKDVLKAPRIADPLYGLTDALLARTLLACAYALALGDPGGTALLGADPSRRHDFGFLERQDETRRRRPWLLPVEQTKAGVPWHVLGSALALDVGLSKLALRRVAGDRPLERPGTMNANDQRTFMNTVALLDTGRLVDGERDDIASAIARGRSRVRAAVDSDALDTLAREVHSFAVDGLRQRALRWVLTHAPDQRAEWFSMVELAELGSPSVPMHAWGMSGLALESCLCTNLPANVPWQFTAGQTAFGVLAAKVADLNLRVLEISAEMKIPAALARPVLAAAVRAFLDTAAPSDPDDWMTLVRTAQRITRDDVEDYMAGLTSSGILAPVTSGGTDGGHQ